MQSYFVGRYWWIGITAIVVLTFIFYYGLEAHRAKPAPQPTARTAPTPAPATSPRPAIAARVPSQPVLELFHPSDENITRDQAISRIRGELEQLFVIRTLLAQCDLITDIEAENIRIAAQHYTEQTRLFADSHALIDELSLQAKQTYDLVYSATSCNEASLPAIKAQTLAWQAQYLPTK